MALEDVYKNAATSVVCMDVGSHAAGSPFGPGCHKRSCVVGEPLYLPGYCRLAQMPHLLCPARPRTDLAKVGSGVHPQPLPSMSSLSSVQAGPKMIDDRSWGTRARLQAFQVQQPGHQLLVRVHFSSDRLPQHTCTHPAGRSGPAPSLCSSFSSTPLGTGSAAGPAWRCHPAAAAGLLSKGRRGDYPKISSLLQRE